MRTTGIPRRTLLQMSLGAALGALTTADAGAAEAVKTARVADANATVDLNRKGLQIAITGSGSALPDPFRGGASCALVIDGKVLQFDFGRQVMENLMLMGVSPMQIDDIYFTHLHFDHINDYDYYATATWLSGLQKDVHVYGPPGTKFMSDSAITGMHKVMYDHIRAMRTRPVRPLNVRPEPPFLIEEVSPGAGGRKRFVQSDVRQGAAYRRRRAQPRLSHREPVRGGGDQRRHRAQRCDGRAGQECRCDAPRARGAGLRDDDGRQLQ